MGYKAVPETITSEPKSPSMMQPFDTIDIEKSLPPHSTPSTTNYGTLPPSKEGRFPSSSPPTTTRARAGGIWMNFMQSLVAVGMFTFMGVVMVLVVL
ncbi:hypothetical protein CJF32_00003604 [Rutstroemia sp. NJR-2017a WRK4]|nr:hypothetical protein CJF32_00003604 [Rutstroemia sp. NJR-2017a WRK4]